MNEHAFGGSWDKRSRVESPRIDNSWDEEDSPVEAEPPEAPAAERGRQRQNAEAMPSPDRRLLAPRYRQLPAERPEFAPPQVYSAAAEYAADPREGGFDLRKYLWLLFKHRWLILGCAALTVSLGALNTVLTTPIYRANATLQINREVPQVVTVDGFQQVEAGDTWEFYQTQFELLKSRSLAERVVADNNLHEDAAFMGANVPSILSNLKRRIFGAPPSTATSSSANVAARQRAAAGRVMSGFSLQPVNESTIVRISFESPNPQVAQKVVNAIADTYIQTNLERRYGASTYARTFLEERLEELKLKLEESERVLVAYAEEKDIVGSVDGPTLTQTDVAAANSELSQATNRRLKLELLWEQIQASEGIGVPQMLESASISAKRAERDALSKTYQEQLSFFKPAYPAMRELQAQIAELERQMAEEVNLIRQSVQAEHEAALAEEKQLTERLESLKGEFADFRNRNIDYTILQREVDTNRTLYDGLLQRYKEIGVAGGVGSNNISIVDRAELPGGPYTPDLRRNLTTALMIGLLLGIGAAFAREQLDDTFRSPDDVEDALGIPLLGAIPISRSSKDHGLQLDDPQSHASEAYRSLRTALQFSTSDGVPRTLLVTSALPEEGKSTTAVTLARNYAGIGMKVLLIDADLRRPSLHKHLSGQNEVGLTNCLASTTVPAGVFQKSGSQGLTFMASGPLPPNPAELLASPKMLTLLTVAAEEYDMIIIDGPPVAGLADAPLLSSITTGTLFVIDSTRTRRKAAKAAIKRLQFARAQIVGAVVNKLDISGSGYGYGYGAYGYGYTQYYGEDQRQIAFDGRLKEDGRA
jgi:succinoglycan biosynthesis transport protein ExoP